MGCNFPGCNVPPALPVQIALLKLAHDVWQVLIHHEEGVTGDELERELFILRKLIEKEKVRRIGEAVADQETEQEAVQNGADPADFYICTLSNRQIVYKVRCYAGRWPSGRLDPAPATAKAALG